MAVGKMHYHQLLWQEAVPDRRAQEWIWKCDG